MKKCLIYIVRHGQTNSNVERILQGWDDIPLNDEGKKQAKFAAERLKELPIKAIYTSTLQRCLHTAHSINDHHRCPLIPHPDLREGRLGVFEGLHPSKYSEELRRAWDVFTEMPIEVKYYHKVVPEMESMHEVSKRIFPIMSMIGNKHPGEEVIVVTHGGVIRCLHQIACGLSDTSLAVGNCDIVKFTCDGEKIEYLEIM
jgi:broad specificity phosphatase PhoE